MATFCKACGRPVRRDSEAWVHYDEHITHAVAPVSSYEAITHSLGRTDHHTLTQSERQMLEHLITEEYQQVKDNLCGNYPGHLMSLLSLRLDTVESSVKFIIDNNDDHTLQHLALNALGYNFLDPARNRHIMPLMQALYARRAELSPELASYLDWLVSIHHWPLR